MEVPVCRRRRRRRQDDTPTTPSDTLPPIPLHRRLAPLLLSLMVLTILAPFPTPAHAFFHHHHHPQQQPGAAARPSSSSPLSTSTSTSTPFSLSVLEPLNKWRRWPSASLQQRRASSTQLTETRVGAAAATNHDQQQQEEEAAAATNIQDGESPARQSPPTPAAPAPGSKEEMFEALQSHNRRKEAFEVLWNSDFEFTEAEYQELLKACFRLGYVNPFKDLVDEVQRLNVPVALETWTACIYIAASREFFRLGIACLEKMVETGTIPDGKSFNQIMSCCEKKGRAEEAMYLFNFMQEKQIEAPPLTYWALASLLSCEGRWDEFKVVEENLRARDFPESIKERFYSTAVVARSGARDWQGALDMLRRMHDCGAVPSLRGFTTALSTCMAAGAYQQVRDFVEEVRGWGIFEFDVATYNVVINSYASEKNVEGAAEWFEKIYEVGLKPSLISYSTMFKVCTSTKRGDLAKTYLTRLITEKDLEPNLITLNHAIQALAVSRAHLADARDLLENMPQRFGVSPNATAYNFLLRAAGEKGDARLTMELYHRMKKVDGLEPEPRTIWEATIACTKCRSFGSMEELADDLMSLSADEGGHDSARSLLYAYNALLTALEKDGDGELALRLYAHMQAQGLQADVVAIVRLLEALNKGRMPERCLKVWSELEGRRADVRQNVNVTNAVLNAMSSIDPLGAVELFQDLRGRAQVDDRSYSFVFAAYDNLGDVAGVQRLWGEMREMGLAFDRVSYGSLLRALANSGEIDQAMEGLRRSEEVGVPLNNYTVALALIGCKRSRRWGTALSMLRELRDEKGLVLNVVCYNSVLTVCNAAGQWRACLKLLEEMNEHGIEPDYTSLRVTLNALASAGRNAEVVRLFRQHQKEGGILSRKLDNFAFRLIANAFIKSDTDAAVEMIKDYLAKFDGSTSSSSSYNNRGKSSAAFHGGRDNHNHHHTLPPLIDSRLYKALITALGHKGDWTQALEVLKSLSPPLRDISTISAAASALLRSEQYGRAKELLTEAEGESGIRFDSVADSLGLQAAYMAQDYPQAEHYLEKLVKAKSHGNSSVNFGCSLMAKQGKWTELATLVEDIAQQQETQGRRFIVSKTTIETLGNVTRNEADGAVREKIMKALEKMKEPETAAASASAAAAATAAAAAAAAAVAAADFAGVLGAGDGEGGDGRIEEGGGSYREEKIDER